MEALRGSEVAGSLLTERTSFGVDDDLFTINLIVAMIVMYVTRSPLYLLLPLATHAALVLVTQLQPQLLQTYLRHSFQKGRYSPFAGSKSYRWAPSERCKQFRAQLAIRESRS